MAMIMKKFHFNIIILLIACLYTLNASATTNDPIIENAKTDTLQSKYVRRYTSFWQSIIPRYTKIQYAGSMGIISVGTGWNYGHNHWETDLWLGYVPKYTDKHAMITFTLKQHYIPWNIDLGKKFRLSPLTCGIFINTLLDRDFWITEPDRYPKGYYGFSTRIRSHIFLGQKITFKLQPNKPHKSISLYYDISTCDLYLISAFTNHYLKPKDYLSLGFGLQFQIL